MPAALPAGPYRTFETDGLSVPLFIIPFDKEGRCLGPETRDELLKQVSDNRFTDLFLFSHGWNNDFPTAVGRYEHFIDGFVTLRRTLGIARPTDYRPLLVGIYWPSTALVFGDEVGPKFAANDPRQRDPAVEEHLAAMTRLADGLPDDPTGKTHERFYELSQCDELDEAEALELAKLVLSIRSQSDEEVAQEEEPTPESLVKIWRANQKPAVDLFEIGISPKPGDAAPVPAAPNAAGFLGNALKKLDPRPALRLATVWQMKDRAGVVGARGVGPLLVGILRNSAGRVHLLGHSYGGKVVLTATCFQPLPRLVDSMFLLQPAVSHLCFAPKVPGADFPGGYHEAPKRVLRPILSTFSSHDFPLTKAFHFAVRRDRDLGEVKIAALPPSQFAALGGFGPRECGEKIISLHQPGAPYEFDSAVPVYGLQSSEFITGHGEISNAATWWALHQLTAAPST